MSTMSATSFQPRVDDRLVFTMTANDLASVVQMPVSINQQRIEADRTYVPPKDPLPLAVLDINAMRWSNVNNVFMIFHQVDVLGVFIEVVWRSLGQPQYQYSILHDWVELMLGFGDYHDPETGLPEPPIEEVSYLQDSVFQEFCNWVMNNQAFITQVIHPLLVSGVDIYNLKQQRTTSSIVFHAG